MIFSKEILLPAVAFVGILTFALGCYLTLSSRAAYRGKVQSRLNVREGGGIQTHEELLRVRQSRSLTPEGHYLLPLFSINRLLLQSGTSVGLSGFIGAGAIVAALVFLGCKLAGLAFPAGMVVAIGAGAWLPFMVLRNMRAARQTKFEEQLPDAIDVMVRSLRAGHALPVAISAVARNMPEPIGSEFRLTAAEVTYGLDLETAMINLRSRVGQSDLALIVLAVSIQSRTGGNLAEILSNLSRVIRERFKLRRKAYALSAEGRFSAILLSLLPIVLFAVLRLISPNYYGDVWTSPYVKPVLTGAIAWMLIGDYIMYQMVRIRV